MNRRFAFVVPLVIALVLLGCTAAPPPDPSSVYTVVSEATLEVGEPIPEPTEQVILTVTGLIGTTNQEDTIVMDLPTIEAVGLVEYDVVDPAIDEQVIFTGPLMSDLLDVWQVPDEATTLSIVALNDYSIDVSIADMRQYPVIFAIQANGAYIPIAERGPSMLVFPYDDYDFDPLIYDAQWIWQIASIDIQ